ncbi:hypothetical protein ACIOKD_26180 [Streptomyces sp. NPDC087844]|uniref:hypothetical protein n=1 Tax=Streptomyces sp. NPDC087844 TaxID=3365805 RepID=UPI003801E8C8
MEAFADNQPVMSVVNTLRDLFAHEPVSSDIRIALVSCVGILIVVYALAMSALPPQGRLQTPDLYVCQTAPLRPLTLDL